MLVRTQILRNIPGSEQWEPSLISVDFRKVARVAVPVIVQGGLRKQIWEWTELRYRNGDKELIMMPFSESLRFFAQSNLTEDMLSRRNFLLESMN